MSEKSYEDYIVFLRRECDTKQAHELKNRLDERRRDKRKLIEQIQEHGELATI